MDDASAIADLQPGAHVVPADSVHRDFALHTATFAQARRLRVGIAGPLLHHRWGRNIYRRLSSAPQLVGDIDADGSDRYHPVRFDFHFHNCFSARASGNDTSWSEC